MRKLIIILIVLCSLGLIWYCFRPTPIPIPQKIVEVITVRPEQFQQSINLLGVIHPKHAIYMVAKGAGVLDVLVPTGQKVQKGTLIAKIDNPDIEQSVQLSVSSEDIAKNQLERFKPLLEKGYISNRELEDKKQDLLNAQKELAKSKIERDNLRFYAPFDGIIGAYKKREGAQVNVGESVVALYDPTKVVVDFDVPCSNILHISPGQIVHVFGRAYPLSHIQPMLDEDTHMCPADVDIKCEDCLMGATVPVNLVIKEEKNAIIVPFQAIFLKNSKPHVYIVDNGKVALVSVTTGAKQKDKIEIISGLKGGQQLVVKGQERLYPTMSVDAIPAL